MPPVLDDLLRAVATGEAHPVYLVEGDLVLAEPQAVRLAEALAQKTGCQVERYRRPPSLLPILADLRTYSLFASGKVVLVLDAALLADEKAAAELIDQAGEGVPGPDGELEAKAREAASRLLQALRVFGIDPRAGSADEVIAALPKWALQGGRAYRKGRPRGRPAKEVKTLATGLAALLEAALQAELVGFAEGDLAELGAVVEGGLPPGHSLVLAEHSVAAEHPLVSTLKERGAALTLGKVEAGRGGDWQGLGPLVAELERECGAGIASDALAELARRTLRQSGDFRSKSVDAGSTSRFAGEYRKLAALAAGGRISLRQVVETVEDRGEEDVWQIMDAVGGGRGGEAVTRLGRYVAAADDAMAARLSFFALLAGFCRQLVAVSGVAEVCGVPLGERNYNRFKDRLAPRLQDELDHGSNPLLGLHPYRLFRSYLTASNMPRGAMSELPAWVLETELRLKGESTDADAALTQLLARLAKLVRR